MAPRIIVSYDDTDNDRDALALGRLLAHGGAELSLAYVRHTHDEDTSREAQSQKEAEELLERGAESIGAPDLKRHVVVHASTGDGLVELAQREKADLVVFGSDYRTAPGAVIPGTSAQRLLGGGRTAVAVAPADFRSRSSVTVNRIRVLADDGDEAPEATAKSLAAALGATVTDDPDEPADLLIVGSREGAPEGRVELSASAGYAVEIATSPVIAVPRGKPVPFAEPALSGAS